MNRAWDRQTLHVTALVALPVSVCAVLLSEFPWSNPWAHRAAVFCGCFAVALAASCYVLSRWRRYKWDVIDWLDRFCRPDRNSLSDVKLDQALAEVTGDDPHASVKTALLQCLGGYRELLEQAEHSRTRVEVRLRRLVSDRDQLREIVHELPEPLLAVNQYDELILANESARRLFSLPEDCDSESVQERAVETVVHCQQLVDLITDSRRKRVGGRRVGEIELDEGDQRRHYRVTVQALSSTREEEDDESNRGAVAVLRDISHQRAIQRRNAEFVSAVSHEMKTPLSGIKAYVELLADGDADDEETREEFLRIINGQADRLQRLIDNLLNLSRIEAGVVDVNKQPCSLNDVLEEAFHVVQPAAVEKGVELRNDLSEMYLSVLVDRDMVLQSAINLLSNAIKYTHAGGEVTLRSRLKGEDVQFDVIDTGVGLSEEDAQRVFQKFYRVKKDRQMASGTGLGLPLAKHIVEDVHGGRIEVVSVLGAGSTFRVSLPLVGQLEAVAV